MSNDGGLYQQLNDEEILKAAKRFGMPVDLSIKRFKKYLKDEFPNLTKAQRNYAIRKYKTEAWSDYDTMVTTKFAEPTRLIRKKETDGKQSEQATDLPLAGE